MKIEVSFTGNQKVEAKVRHHIIKTDLNETQNDLGLYYKDTGDLEKAKDWLLKSANQNFALAECNLGLLFEKENDLIKAEEYYLKAAEKALNEGHDLKEVLEKFNLSLKEDTILVGQNIGFDIPIVACEFYRKSIESKIQNLSIIDTAREGTDICALPGGYGGGFKFPKLSELYKILFGHDFNEAHNAAADVNATAQAFWELVRLRQIEPSKLKFSNEELDSFISKNPNKIEAFDIHIRNQVESFNNELNKDNNKDKKAKSVEIDYSNFFHFHTHTVYSILTSTNKHSDIIKKSIESKMPALGVVDFGNLMGAFAFLNEVKKTNKNLKNSDEEEQEILPIIGCEVFISDNYKIKKFTKENPDKRYTQVLLAKNHEGFKNLSKISSIGYTDGLYSGFPRVGKEIIEKYKENLIATTGSLSSEIPSLVLNIGESQAEEAFKYWHNLFKDDFYIELHRHGLEEENHLNEVLLKFAKKYDVKVLAQNEPYYIDKTQSEAFKSHFSAIS